MKKQNKKLFIACSLAFLLVIVGNFIGNQIPIEKIGPVTLPVAAKPDQIRIHNERSIRILLDERRRASLVTPKGVPENVIRSVCGPAAIYTGLIGISGRLEDQPFANYVSDVYRTGHLSGVLEVVTGPGMDDQKVKDELMRLGISSHRVWRYSGAQAAAAAVREVDAGRLVLLVKVYSDQSFQLITHTKYPHSGGIHIVRVAATYWDGGGRVEKVAVYDVNAYNGTSTENADSRPVRFIDYQDFVRLLQVNLPDFGMIVSDRPINRDI